VEEQIAAVADEYTPGELFRWGRRLIELYDQDGPPPDGKPLVCDLRITRYADGGGKISGRFEDPAQFAIIAAVLDAKARPLTSRDERGLGQRQADAMAEVFGFVSHHGDRTDLPLVGGVRPSVMIGMTLPDLENRLGAACLDFGGTLDPAAARLLACDAHVIPIVLNGDSRPLDVGRGERTVPIQLRWAVTYRDRRCAHPGCDRPPTWCECHHVKEWADGGETTLDNLVLLCRTHHREIHSTEQYREVRPLTVA
jgi:Domain of unknown function (DUF222)/HNH endonuclease